ncbi:hypothetical protein [Marinobacter oulmenensis]|uniref:Uncharacterized protein n=1 Tax=Marinobacter oulmenensis TaxID=643747 RepID=A0A840UAP8_9GAMM|nr:hypothetical protein [Marinobacter oulmenensis]MBB5320310.1 hypothetical protein [Marinobacter oulmenensis]
MASVLLAILGTFIGLLIYYVRTISVLVDERDNIEKDEETYDRYKWLYIISEKMESIWPFVKAVDATKWVNIFSNVALVAACALLLSVGLFKNFLLDYAEFVLMAFFVLASISSGPKSFETYNKMKPYLPVIFPAIAYQAMTMLEIQRPEVAQQLVMPGYEFMESKLIAALVGFTFAFLLPYPMAKFDQWFSRFLAKSTLHFLKDFMRLGVKPINNIEISQRKAAKESIAVTLKILLALIGLLSFILHSP